MSEDQAKPTRWDQAVKFATERAEVEYLKAIRAGIVDPIAVINIEEFENVDFRSDSPIDPKKLRVFVRTRADTLHWVTGVDRRVSGVEILETPEPGVMPVVVVSYERVDVLSRPVPEV